MTPPYQAGDILAVCAATFGTLVSFAAPVLLIYLRRTDSRVGKPYILIYVTVKDQDARAHVWHAEVHSEGYQHLRYVLTRSHLVCRLVFYLVQDPDNAAFRSARERVASGCIELYRPSRRVNPTSVQRYTTASVHSHTSPSLTPRRDQSIPFSP